VEPQQNKKVDLQKAVSAHEQAEAAIADLMNVSSDPAYAEMLDRLRKNLEVLRAEAATTVSE